MIFTQEEYLEFLKIVKVYCIVWNLWYWTSDVEGRFGMVKPKDAITRSSKDSASLKRKKNYLSKKTEVVKMKWKGIIEKRDMEGKGFDPCRNTRRSTTKNIKGKK